MKTIKITIDGQVIETKDGITVLEAARANGIVIPTLCFHPIMKPGGSCRLCAVEVEGRATGKATAVLSCVLKARDGMIVNTQGEKAKKMRSKAIQNMLRLAPQSKRIRELALKYDIDPGPPADGCIRCRICIRVCKEIVGVGALTMEKRSDLDYVVPIEGRCIGCGTCANICPTEAIRIEDKDNVRTIRIRDEVIGRHSLETCEGCGRPFATSKFLDHIHHRTEKHTDTKEHHRYCPTCAKLFSDRVRSQKVHPQQSKMTRRR